MLTLFFFVQHPVRKCIHVIGCCEKHIATKCHDANIANNPESFEGVSVEFQSRCPTLQSQVVAMRGFKAHCRYLTGCLLVKELQ